MKKTLKLAYLSMISLFIGVLWVSFFNVVNWSWAWVVMNLETPSHKIRLYDLYLWKLWEMVSENFSRISAWVQELNVLNWLVVYGDKIEDLGSDSSFVIIGWGDDNKILGNAKRAWIVWWNINKVGANSSVIGWWIKNNVDWVNSVIAWGEVNTAWNGGVVVWWGSNEASHEWVVVLWWKNNVSNGKNSLLLWVNSKWGESSFVWNDSDNINIGSDSAYIGASNGILIWTYESKDGVNLVVNWPVKLYETSSMLVGTWEIESYGWCFYAYDGKYWHILGSNKGTCPMKENLTANTCEFGGVSVQQWDKVVAYSQPYVIGTSCESYKQEIVCDNWSFVPSGYSYPYCYSM